LHKRLLTLHSGYFRGELSGKFKETDDGTINLDDVDTDAFDVFVDWPYEKQLPIVSLKGSTHILADPLLVFDLKKAFLEQIFDGLEKSYPTLEPIVYLYEHLPETVPLLQLVVNSFSIHGAILQKLNKISKIGADKKRLKREDYVIKEENELERGGDGGST
jgi:hypothetical protein